MLFIERLPEILELGGQDWRESCPADLEAAEQIAAAPGPGAGDAGSLTIADNLRVMKGCARDGMAGAFQLIYADPPFFSRNNYDAEIKLRSARGKTVPAVRQKAYHDAWEEGMDTYLRMLTARFFAFRELLSDTGCLWVHLDWHALHYVKVILDAIFGEKNFVNEIIWNYKSGGASRRRFARKHDTLLFYGKTPAYHFTPQREKSYNRGFKPYRFKGVKEYRDETGWYTLVNMKDVWQLDMVGRTSAERTGYATQKPEALIERILESCTEEGDLCGDFFGGSGTLAAAAHRMGRRWFLCDAGCLAEINAQKRLIGLGAAFTVFADTETAANAPGRFEVVCTAEETTYADKRLVTVELRRYALPENAAPPVEEKYLPVIESVLREDSLQLVDYWSVDFQYDGKIPRPQISISAEKTGVQTRCARLMDAERDAPGRIAVRVVDIFGNGSLRLLPFAFA